MIYIVKTANGSRRAYNTRKEADAYIAACYRLGCKAFILGELDLIQLEAILIHGRPNNYPSQNDIPRPYAKIPKMPLPKRLTDEQINNLFSYGFLNRLFREEIGLTKRA